MIATRTHLISSGKIYLYRVAIKEACTNGSWVHGLHSYQHRYAINLMNSLTFTRESLHKFIDNPSTLGGHKDLQFVLRAARGCEAPCAPACGYFPGTSAHQWFSYKSVQAVFSKHPRQCPYRETDYLCLKPHIAQLCTPIASVWAPAEAGAFQFFIRRAC